MEILVEKFTDNKFDCDLLAIIVDDKFDNSSLIYQNQLICDELNKVKTLGDFTGKEGENFVFYPQATENFLARRVMFVGSGKKDNKVESNLLRDKNRIVAGDICKIAIKYKVKKLTIVLPDFEQLSDDKIAECITEGIKLTDYRFLKYKSKLDEHFDGVDSLKFIVENNKESVRLSSMQGLIAAESTCMARDMANEPGNSLTSVDFANYASDMAKELNLNCTILDKPEMQELGMGGIIAVNQGSTTPPKLIILEYGEESDNNETILFVGKGLVFDSGGISLKPSLGMQDMKYDMCGGAAVLSLMSAIGKEDPQGVRVVSIIPATDNMPGGGALKPGDIITHYNNKTSEIINTDAEGRLILADALAYGVEKYKPSLVVDIATLTGAVILGLGHHYTGLLSNNDDLADQLRQSGDECGEPLWRLPLGKEYSKQIKSDIADIKNAGGRPAGTVTAAAYLENFVKDTPWAHMDIAGTAWDFTEKSYIPKGPSGTGARTLLQFVRNRRKGETI